MGIEKLQIRAADHMPSALRSEGVDAGLATGDRHRSRRHLARFGKARLMELRGQTLEVGESGRESDRGDGVFGIAVEIDDFGQAEVFGIRQCLQVRAVIPAVGHGDGDGASLKGLPVIAFIKVERG